ncbi:hypothetical protein, partial [Embleya sp. NPDC005971]|uniref:hypothetical protein n=1 Tax=Embleya sp. NPDC005971 TaxID=3156724 RepID=UPI003410BB9C
MTAPEPLDLAAIRADRALAATPPGIGPGNLLLTDSYTALDRILDRHLPALLDQAEHDAAELVHLRLADSSNRRAIADLEATVERYDTALIEAARDLDRAREHIADLDGQIEGQDQALAAADVDRERQAAE